MVGYHGIGEEKVRVVEELGHFQYNVFPKAGV